MFKYISKTNFSLPSDLQTDTIQRRASVTIEFSNITAEELYNYFGS